MAANARRIAHPLTLGLAERRQRREAPLKPVVVHPDENYVFRES